jgi:hypothetical protein
MNMYAKRLRLREHRNVAQYKVLEQFARREESATRKNRP